MKRYYIKCEHGRIEYVDILRETADGFMVRVTRIRDNYEKNIEEFLSAELFEICLKTGYIYETENTTSSVA
ncbi:MAG: hypothetical protein LBQ38_04895 [Spirochaetaceae bacterium]|jgi:hypothetical protein|nr:hypothetical protein [Spirochaetaceae bacterium]